MSHGDHVVFVHGLRMRGTESLWLRRHLEKQFAFQTSVFRYATLSDSLDVVANRLANEVAALKARRLHFIGHSLGGLVLLRLFSACESALDRPGRVVLLGSPVAGSLAARGVGSLAFGRAFMGRIAADELLTECERRWSASRELGVIAGTRSIGLGRFFAGFGEPNDGTVAVRETRIEGAADHVVLPVSHMGMLLSASVAASCGRFLRDGRFGLR